PQCRLPDRLESGRQHAVDHRARGAGGCRNVTATMIILLAASIAYGLSRAVRIPALPLLVLAGIALGIISRTTQLPFSSGEVDALLQLGLAFLVFASGMELNPARVGAQRWPALRVGLAQFAAMTSMGLLLGFGLGFRSMELLYIAL